MTVLNLRRWFRDPLFLLALAAGLIAFVVQSGELGSADTTHRLQTAHSLWTGEPEVFPNEFPEFGVHGRGGKLQSWYSIGQSLLLLPPDVVGTYVARLPIFAQYDDTDPSVRDIIVSYTINILVTVLTALVCFRFLRQLNFGVTQSVVGVLALLLATTHLHYTQNMMENNYIFLLTMTGFSYQYEWLRTGSRRALLIGSAAFGLNLLTRLPTGLDLLAGALFLLLVLWFEGIRGRALWERCKAYIATALPVYLFFGLLDRLYQFYRFGFGSVFVTYITIIGRETRMRNPSLPPNYPFETPWHVGFFGALFTPEKSIFLFDPLTRAHDSSVRRRLEAIQPGCESVRRDELSAATGVHEFLRPLYGVERRLRLGRPLRFNHRRAGSRCSRFRCCCVIARAGQSRCGSLGWRCWPSAP